MSEKAPEILLIPRAIIHFALQNGYLLFQDRNSGHNIEPYRIESILTALTQKCLKYNRSRAGAENCKPYSLLYFLADDPDGSVSATLTHYGVTMQLHADRALYQQAQQRKKIVAQALEQNTCANIDPHLASQWRPHQEFERMRRVEEESPTPPENPMKPAEAAHMQQILSWQLALAASIFGHWQQRSAMDIFTAWAIDLTPVFKKLLQGYTERMDYVDLVMQGSAPEEREFFVSDAELVSAWDALCGEARKRGYTAAAGEEALSFGAMRAFAPDANGLFDAFAQAHAPSMRSER